MVDLKRVSKHSTTYQQIRDEFKKCMMDPAYFMKTYCYIQHPKHGKIKFNLYDFQEQMLHNFRDYDYNIILKSRQLGISTVSAGIVMWMMLFYDNKQCTILATKQETAKNLVTKVRYMYDNLPEFLKSHLGKDEKERASEHNKLSLKLKNGSEVKAISAASDSARSLACSLLIIDEAAFIEDIEETWTSAQQTLATGGKCIVLSTPNGMGNWFYNMWRGAELGKNSFNTIKLKWDVHPERDQAWRDKQTADLGHRMAAQECDADFITSGNSVIDSEFLKDYYDNKCLSPVEKRGIGQNLWIFEYPVPGANYVVCADVARGDGSDYSAYHVIDIDRMVQVAEYQGQVGTTDYGNMLVNIGYEYNEALLVIENANIGWAAIQPALDRGYPNLFYTSKDLMYVDVQQQITSGYDLRDKSSMVPGFSTTTKNRPMIISKMVEYVSADVVKINSKRLISELQTFVWNGPKAEAQRGNHDDLVMAFSIGLWIRDTAIKLKMQGLELQRKSLELLNRSMPVYNHMSNSNNPWKMKTGKDTEDLTWLIQ